MDNFNNIFEKSELVMKYLRDELTVSEIEQLDNWLSESEANKVLFEKITNQDFLNKELSEFSVSDKQKAWDKIVNVSGYERNIIQQIPLYKAILKYAAIIVFILLSVTVIYKNLQNTNKHHNEIVNKQDVAPGGNKATLTLADGTTILLDEADNGELARQTNIVITKTKDGQLIYDLSGSKSENRKGNVEINTINTPAGGQYQLILPDGTKVYLNSLSSLKFPVIFTGESRNVTVTGEAYFEVAKNKKMPFIVSINDVNVEVLGTQFNIMAYKDENFMKTTLLEGSVKITKGNAKRILIPGKQALTNSSEEIEVVDADVEEATAWKNGYFKFNKQDIKSIMRQLSRWYNIDVVYEGNVPTDEFVGKIRRNSNLSQVLKILEFSEVKYKIEGKKIIINP